MKIATLLRIAIAASVVLVSTAHAQLFRAYLASDGNDGNPCTLQAPCRLLPAALNAVASGGEIWMLDSANYNTATVTINKSVSILAVPGVVGSVVALNGGPAISVAADNLTVSLRNLVIGPVAGTTPGTGGVSMNFVASSLTIENSLIANLPMHGVRVEGPGKLKVANTTFRNNGFYAIALGGGATATISRTQMSLANGSGGIVVAGSYLTTTASLSESVISGGDLGVVALGPIAAGVISRISVSRSTIERTLRPLYSEANEAGTAEISVGGSLIVNNNNAWYQQGTGAAILSLGDNQMSGNGSPIGVLTPLPPQ